MASHNTTANDDILSRFSSSSSSPNGGFRAALESLLPHSTPNTIIRPVTLGVSRTMLDQILKGNHAPITTETNNNDDDNELLTTAMDHLHELEKLENNAQLLYQTVEADMARIQPLLDRARKLEHEIADVEACRTIVEALHHAITMEETFPAVLQVFQLLRKTPRQVAPACTKMAIQHVRQVIDRLRPTLEKELTSALKAIGWPVKSTTTTTTTTAGADTTATWARNIPVPKRTAAVTCFQNLLQLQLMWFHVDETYTHNDDGEIIHPLWAVECAARPLVIRFQYHFCGNHATNRVDRPEWFVAFCLHAIRDHASFFIEPSISKSIAPIIPTGIFVDLNSHFIKCFVDQMNHRMKSHMPILLTNEALLCHYMDEIVSADRTLLGELAYADAPHWPTLTSFFSLDKERFQAWINADLKFARGRLTDLLASPTAWSPLTLALMTQASSSTNVVVGTDDGKSGGKNALLGNPLRDYATESSERVLSVVDSLSRRFDTLVSDKAKYEFVEQVQNTLLHEYAMACSQAGNDSAGAFISRANSLQHVVDTLYEWSLKPKYVFAYHPTQEDDNATSSSSGAVVARVVMKGVKSRLNVTRMLRGLVNIGTEQEGPSVNNVSGGVFAHVITHVRKLLNDEMMRELDRMDKAVIEASHRGLTSKTWISGLMQQDDDDLSPEMCLCLSVVKDHVARWSRALHPALRRRLATDSARMLQDYFYDVCVRDNVAFSQAGGEQLSRDCAALFALYTSFDKSPANVFFARLNETTRILRMDANTLMDIRNAGWEMDGGGTVLGKDQVESLCRKRRDVLIV